MLSTSQKNLFIVWLPSPLPLFSFCWPYSTPSAWCSSMQLASTFSKPHLHVPTFDKIALVQRYDALAWLNAAHQVVWINEKGEGGVRKLARLSKMGHHCTREQTRPSFCGWPTNWLDWVRLTKHEKGELMERTLVWYAHANMECGFILVDL
jgi:hypothetical protein